MAFKYLLLDLFLFFFGSDPLIMENKKKNV